MRNFLFIKVVICSSNAAIVHRILALHYTAITIISILSCLPLMSILKLTISSKRQNNCHNVEDQAENHVNESKGAVNTLYQRHES